MVVSAMNQCESNIFDSIYNLYDYIHIDPPLLSLSIPLIPTFEVITEYPDGLPVLYSSFPLVIYFAHDNPVFLNVIYRKLILCPKVVLL